MFVHNFNIITYKAKHTFYCDDFICFCRDLICRKSSVFIKDLNFYLPLFTQKILFILIEYFTKNDADRDRSKILIIYINS